jgi:hypothetical protein
VRLWTVPLVYSIGLSDEQLVIVQTVLSIGAWVAAAVMIARIFERRVASTGALAGVLVIGLTAPITNWDAFLGSESIGLSLLVLLIALGANVLCRPSKRLVWSTFIVAFFWAFTRPSNAYVLLVVSAAVALVALRRPRRRELAVLACVLGVVTLAGIAVSNTNRSVQRWNLAEIIGRRVVTDASRLEWWRQEGMPRPPASAVQPDVGDRKGPDAKIFAQLRALNRDRRFHVWLDHDAPATYLHFLITHPGYVLTTPIDDRAVLDGFLRPSVRTDVRHVVPGLIEDAVWPPTRTEAFVVALLSLAVVAFFVWPWRRRHRFVLSQRQTRALAYAAFLVGVSLLAAFVFAHLAGAAFDRVLLTPAVALRFGVVIAGASFVDAFTRNDIRINS